jgi:hypothetical protein
MSERAHTGQSEAIHSPEACANTVVKDTVWMSWSMVVVCRVAIPCSPKVLRTMSRPLERGPPWLIVAVGRDPPSQRLLGLVSTICALASAAARAAIDSLDRCMSRLRLDHLEAHRPRLRALGPDPMAKGLLGVLPLADQCGLTVYDA